MLAALQAEALSPEVLADRRFDAARALLAAAPPAGPGRIKFAISLVSGPAGRLLELGVPRVLGVLGMLGALGMLGKFARIAC